jgi:hypothetical protein
MISLAQYGLGQKAKYLCSPRSWLTQRAQMKLEVKREQKQTGNFGGVEQHETAACRGACKALQKVI